MAPANPPLPMPWNFPFQPLLGIHTSNLMSESEVGLMTPVTRQNSGRSLKGAAGPDVIGKAPAAMACAEVIVVFESFSAASFSQDCAETDPGLTATITSAKNGMRLNRLCRLLSVLFISPPGVITFFELHTRYSRTI